MKAVSSPGGGDALLLPDAGYAVEAITSEAGLWAARDDWERLEHVASEPNVFTTWGWIWSWWRVFGRVEPATRLFILTARKGGQLEGVLPLVVRSTRRFSFRKLEFPDLPLADYMDPLLDGNRVGALTAMFAFLAGTRNNWDLLVLRRVRPDGGLNAVITDSLKRAGLPWRDRSDEAYLWLPITGKWEQMQSPRSGQTFRAKLKRLTREGFECRFIEHPEREVGLLDRMAEVERKRIVQGGAPGLLLAQETAFFSQIFENLGAAGWLFVGVVEREGSIVAYELGFRCGRKLWVYTKGYDASYASFSPGSVLTAAIIDYGFQHGYEEYDMLRGREEFKQRLSECLHEQVRFEVWNRSARSRLAGWLYYGLRVALISSWWRLLGRPIHPDL